jgi:hypothetical protein
LSALIRPPDDAANAAGLNSYFGDKLHEDIQNYIVSSAQLLIEFFNKGYKCTDE